MFAIFVLARCGREIDEGGRPRGSVARPRVSGGARPDSFRQAGCECERRAAGAHARSRRIGHRRRAHPVEGPAPRLNPRAVDVLRRRHGVDRSAGARRLDGLAARHRGGAARGAARGGGERAGAGAAADVARRAAREGRRRGVPHRPHRLAAGDAVAGRRHRRVRRRRRAGDGDAAAPLGAPPPRRLPAVAEAPDAHAVDAGGGARRRRARGRREWPPRRRGGARRRAAAGDAGAAVDPAGRGRHVLGARDHRALRPVRVRRRPRHRWPPLPRPPRDLVAVRGPTAPRARARNSAAQFRRAIHSAPNRPTAGGRRASGSTWCWST